MNSSPDQSETPVTPRPDPANPLLNPPTRPGPVRRGWALRANFSLIDEPKLAEQGEGHRVLVKLGEMMHQEFALLSVSLFKLLLTSGFHPFWIRPALQLLTLILIARFNVGESG